MSKRKKIILIVLVTTAVILSGAAIFACNAVSKAFTKTVDAMQQIDKEEIELMTNENVTPELSEYFKDKWTIAAFGLDNRDDDLSGGNSDVIMLIVLDPESGNVRIASVYRDTCLKVGNGYEKINSAYAKGGPAGAVEALNENLDLQIDDYVAVSWKAVAEAINLLGGIDVEISDAEFKYINGYITETVNSTGIGSVQIEEAGINHLDGVQAVAYCRIRYSDNDFKRTERQRKVIDLCVQKAKETDITTLCRIAAVLLPEVASSIDEEDLMVLAKNILNLNIEATEGFPSDNFVKTVNKVSYVFPTDLTESVAELHLFLYGNEGYEPSRTVKEISEKIKEKSGTSKKDTSASNNAAYVTPVIETEPEETEPVYEKIYIEEIYTETAEAENISYEEISDEDSYNVTVDIISDEDILTDAEPEIYLQEPSLGVGPGYDIQITPSEANQASETEEIKENEGD